MDAPKPQGLFASGRNRKPFQLGQCARKNGMYAELREPQYTAEKEHARERLVQYSEWWLTPLAERRERSSDLSIEPVFFRIDIESMSGLRGIPE